MAEDSDRATLGPSFRSKYSESDWDLVFRWIRRLHDWTPKSEVAGLVYGPNVPIVLSVFPAMGTVSKILTLHRPKGLPPIRSGRVQVAGVAGVVAAVVSGTVHLETLFKPVLLQQEVCPVCTEVRAVSAQMVTGVLLPHVISVLGMNLILERLSYRRPGFKPGETGTFRASVRWGRQMFNACRGILLFNGILQAAVISLLLLRQRLEWEQVRTDIMESRKSRGSKRTQSSLITEI